MKIGTAIIQTRNIHENTEDDFNADYKGYSICITTDHGHGEPREHHLKRYDIEVVKHSGPFATAVSTVQDFHTMRDAIRYALIGACLMPADKVRHEHDEYRRKNSISSVSGVGIFKP